MIRIEAEGTELVAVIRALAKAMGGSTEVVLDENPSLTSPSSSPVLPSAPYTPPSVPTPAESFWSSEVSSSVPLTDPQKDPRAEQVESGGIAWYHIVSTWSRNFGTEGEQPDRMKCITDTMLDESISVYAFVRNAGGLTQAVRSVAPQMTKRQSRLIAENIASVTSALGIVGLTEMLEYSKEYRKIGSR